MIGLAVKKTEKMERTPKLIGEEVRNLTYQARCMSVYYGIEIGRRLVEAKQLVGHGGWVEWVKNETEFSQSQANRFMKIFDEYGDDQIGIFGVAPSNSSTLTNLSISNALRLLAIPKDEREDFAAEVDAQHISARELDKAIRERDEARRKAEEAKAEMAAAEQARATMESDMVALKNLHERAMESEDAARMELEKAKAELRALRDKPVEVAVEVDEAAVCKAAEEARAAEEAKWKRKLDAAERKLKDAAGEKQALKDRINDLMEKAKNLGTNGNKENARLSEEVDTLKKQLAMSDSRVVTFKARLENMNSAFSCVEDALEQLEPEMRKKLSAAACAQLDVWKKALVKCLEEMK